MKFDGPGIIGFHAGVLTPDRKTYSEKDVYAFCVDRITDDILNTPEAIND